MDYLSGIVDKITFINEESGFTILKIKLDGYVDLVTVIGTLSVISIGSIVKFTGEWKNDSKFGRQFIASMFEETLPATIVGIERYLGSGLIKGIGGSLAKRIVKHFKESTLKIMEERIDDLLIIEGIGNKKLKMIKTAWNDQKEIKNVMLFLQSYNVSTSHAVKIYKTYGNKSIATVKENPYKLADDIWGIGFKTADIIAQNLGIDKNSFERCRSGLVYVLNEMSNDGHCYATKTQLLNESIKILDIKKDIILDTIEKLINENTIIFDINEALYLPHFYYSEVGIAQRVHRIISSKSQYKDLDVDEKIEKIQEDCQVTYDKIQIEAIKIAATSKFMVLTGGPGTGKTTTTLAIISVFLEFGAKVLLAAPTGRAAKRMTEISGMESKTIHRLLEYRPNMGYVRNAENPIECDVLIIDEASMIDLLLMYNLLKAVLDSTTIILVGDIDQLPSVSAGNVLKDIIDSDIVNIVRLNHIFRQAQGSMIITNAHKVNKGEQPILQNNITSDFFFIKEEDSQKAIELIKDLCLRRLPNKYKINPLDDIQILCPMQKGDIGCQNLNLVLQESLNPSLSYIRFKGIMYKFGDKIMQIKNNYEKNVFNGDIGRITHINNEDKTLIINFDGNEIEYDISEMDEVMLAYAITIHKSQGSEYKIVIAPFAMQHYSMLQRNLLYTCITRAKKTLILIGSPKALKVTVMNNKSIERNTLLALRLAEKDYISGTCK